MTGPVIGSVLYDAGGFITPFLVIGAAIAVMGLLSIVTNEKLIVEEEYSDPENDKNDDSDSLIKLMRTSGVLPGNLSLGIFHI